MGVGDKPTAVSDATLPSTVCRRGGYTGSVRPPRDVTDTDTDTAKR